MKDYELGKKDRIISELIEQKMELEQQLSSYSTSDATDKEKEIQKMKSQIESMRLEKEEILKFTAGGTKSESYQLIKDLSNENAKLRMKLITK